MNMQFAKDNIMKLINKYIDEEDFDSAYELFLKNTGQLSYEEREGIQYAFPPKYFEKIKNSGVPYYKHIKYELEKGDPAAAYEIYLNDVKDSQKKRLLFLNQCLSAARKCVNIVRKARIESIIKKILPEHQKHVNDVSPEFSMEYDEFCNELDMLYSSYDINDYDMKTLKVYKSLHDLDRVKELLVLEKLNDARELFLEIEKRKLNGTLPLSQNDAILFNAKRQEVLATRERVIGLLKKRADDYCLRMFKLKRYDEIKTYYEKLVETGLYNGRSAVNSMERILLTLVDGILYPLLGTKIVNVSGVVWQVLSSEIVKDMMNESLISKSSLEQHLTSVILTHNKKIKIYVREAEEERRRLVAREQEEQRILVEKKHAKRRTCDWRARDIRNHGVRFLYHFTKLTNVGSILQNGILSREILDELNIVYAGNDNGRYDGRLDTTSISLSFPNWQMFYSLRMQDECCKWAVVEIDVGMLDENTFECYSTNAATQSGKFRVYKGCEMFGNSQDEFPEDPQAELLVEGRIDPKYITKIYVNDDESKKMLDGISKPVEINRYFFNKRRKDV